MPSWATPNTFGMQILIRVGSRRQPKLIQIYSMKNINYLGEDSPGQGWPGLAV
jgi:hypothetical protein